QFMLDNPDLTFTQRAERFDDNATVEDLNGIFEEAVLVGGTHRNVMVVGSMDNAIVADGRTIAVDPWAGRAVLDNQGHTENSLSEYYIINFNGHAGGRVEIRDTGGRSGFDELVVNGTNGPDQVTLDAQGSGPTRSGAITVGASDDPQRDIVSYRGIERVTVDT